MDELKAKVLETIRKYRMLEPGDRVILGLSGGPDSVCLLYVLHELSEELNLGEITAVHVNHGLRGRDSRQDEEYARQLAEQLEIPFEAVFRDVGAVAKEQSISVEMAGRAARYQIFEEYRQHRGADRIAVAHHRDDQAETILMRILRGTGIRGLGGMRPVSGNGVIIRPLLETGRRDIEAWCSDRGLNPRTDRSNFDTIYTRNRVRLELLPELETKYNPNIREALIRLGEQAAEADALAGALARQYMNSAGSFSAAAGNRWSPAEKALRLDGFEDLLPATAGRVLLNCLEETGMEDGISAVVLDNLYRVALGEEPAEADLPGGGYALKSYGKLWFARRRQGENRAEDPVPVDLNSLRNAGAAPFSVGDTRIFLTLEELQENPGVSALRSRGDLVMDADCFPADASLAFRNRRPGDRFRPVGMKGSKKLQDYMVDRKIPRHRREDLLLLATGSQIWMAGREVSGDCAVTEKTRRILILNY